MGSKSKGTRAERELFHMFYNSGMQPIRVAGSGNTTIESCDLLIGGNGRVLAIECKTLRKGRKYLDDKRIDELKEFSRKFGAEPWIGMKFNYLGWYFFRVDDLKRGKGKNFVISAEGAKVNGLSFEELLGKF